MSAPSHLARLVPSAIWLLVPVLLLLLLSARVRAASNSIPQYVSRVWQMEDGLPHTIVQAITQSRDGYLWVGTREGLARFDGVRFVSWTAREFGTGLVQPSITQLRAAQDGSLWIGTENLGLFRLQKGRIARVGASGELKSEMILGVEETPDGTVWIAAEGLARFRDGKVEYPFTPEMTGVVKNLYLDQEGTLWMTGSGLKQVAAGKVTACTPRQGRFPSNPRCLVRDGHGTLWAEDNFGLVSLEDGKVERYPKEPGPAGIIGALLADRAGHLWVGAYSGLSLYLAGRFVPPTDEHLGVDRVFCLYQDREGDVWAGSEGGLVRLTPRQISTYTKDHGLRADSIASVCASQDGTVWVSVWGGGLHRFSDGSFAPLEASNRLGSDFLTAIHEAHDGSLWVGADYRVGLFHLVDGHIARYGQAEGLDPVVTALLEDAQGNTWIGSRDSLTRLSGGTFQHYTRKSGLSSNKINALCERADGGVWIGTEGGLTQWWKDGRFVNLAAKEPRLRNTILSLYEDPERSLWVGTRGAGVVRFSDGVLFNFTSRQGLLSDSIYAILEDDRKNLWFNSSKGIFSVSKAQMEEMARGRRSTLHCVWYCRTAQYREVTQPAATRALDGRLWFRTTHGVVVVDPNMPINTTPPPVAVETVLADKKDISESGGEWASENLPLSGPLTRPLMLPAGRGELEIHYTALSLRAPEMNRFKYRLDGVDSEWVDAGSRRVAHYNSLTPGRYRFGVKACNNDGIWNETGVALDVVVAPHYWQSGWFRWMCGLTAVLLIGGTVRYSTWRRMHAKLQHLEKQHSIEIERTRIARDLHDHLGSRLTEILMVTELSLQRVGDDGQQIKPQLKKSVGLVRELAEGLDAIVWAVDPKNDTLDNFVLYVYEYLDHLTNISPVRILRDVPSHLPDCPLSSTQRHNLLLVLKETLTNVFKHADASEIWFRLHLENGSLTIVLEDNGRGFVPEAASELGNGLLNMEKRMKLINGSFTVTSEPGAGTRVRLQLPLNHTA